MSVLTPTSSHITFIESKIIFNLCTGKLYVDISESVFLPDTQDDTLGVKIKITNPYGVIVKDYPSSSYDLSGSNLLDPFMMDIPVEAGTFQFGTYEVSVSVTDKDGEVFEIKKKFKLSPINAIGSKDKFRKLGGVIEAVCQNESVYVTVDKPQPYGGKLSSYSSPSFTLEFPAISGLDTKLVNSNHFYEKLYDGVYRVSGESCISYDLGDNIFVSVMHKVDFRKEVFCSLNFGCIFEALASAYDKLKSDCSSSEKERLSSIITEATSLVGLTKLAVQAGKDPSEYVVDLKELLGMENCECNDVPILIDCGCIADGLPNTKFKAYWTAKSTGAIPTQDEITSWVQNAEFFVGATVIANFAPYNAAPSFLFMAEPASEPVKTAYYFSDDDKGSIGDLGSPWANGVVVGDYRVYVTNYPTATDILPLQFKVSL